MKDWYLALYTSTFLPYILENCDGTTYTLHTYVHIIYIKMVKWMHKWIVCVLYVLVCIIIIYSGFLADTNLIVGGTHHTGPVVWAIDGRARVARASRWNTVSTVSELQFLLIAVFFGFFWFFFRFFFSNYMANTFQTQIGLLVSFHTTVQLNAINEYGNQST